MIVGNRKIKVTRTDLARYLNEYSEKLPWLIPFREDYMENCNRARKNSVSQFGFWLRTHKAKEFERAFKWAEKHPEILDELYTNTDSTCG